MPLIKFGSWTPSFSDYENQGNVSDVDSMFPTPIGYEPWWGHKTARPMLPESANIAISIYGSASPQVGVIMATRHTMFSNVHTASSVWWSMNYKEIVKQVVWTNSGSNHVMKGSATSLLNFQKSHMVRVDASPVNPGTWTVNHHRLSYSARAGAKLDRLHFSRTVASGSETAVSLVSILEVFDAQWSLDQWRSYCIGTNVHSFPLLASPLAQSPLRSKALFFMDCPFKAGCIGSINEFIVCGNIREDEDTRHTLNKLWWSAIGDPFDWIVDPATQCGNAVLPGSSGDIRAIVSGEYGLILCANEIYRMQYVGPPSIFSISIAFKNVGILGVHAWASHRDMVFIASNSGFKMIFDGSVIHEIGKEDGIDDFFKQDFNEDFTDTLHCAADGKSTRVFWSYRSTKAGIVEADRILCYDWRLKKWSKRTRVGLDYVADVIYSDINDQGIGRIGALDNRNFISWAQTTTAIDTNVVQYIETGRYEHNPGGRAFIKGITPIYQGSGATPSVIAYVQERIGEQQVTKTAGNANVAGEFPMIVTGRYAKYRIDFGGKNFSHIDGFQVNVSNEGKI